VLGRPEHAERFAHEYGLVKLESPATSSSDLPPEVGFAEVLLTPRSRLVDHTVEEVAFREKWRVTVLGVRRMGAVVPGAVGSVRLRFGDTLLVKGPWDRIALLAAERRDFVVISDSPEAKRALRPEHRAPIAGFILLLTMAALTFKIVPAVIAVLCGALAMILSGCVPITDTYRAVSWPSVILVAAMLPMATALQKTGALDHAVTSIGTALQGAGLHLTLGAFYLLTSLLSQVISNTATAVLVSPMAIKVAAALGAPPEPLLIVVAIAASTAFSTPMASPVNTLVAGPGGYTFGDFLRVGIPLQIAIGVITVAMVPVLYV
jgi:di/tricarboxylate transporter